MKTQLIKIASIFALSISTSVFAAGDHGAHAGKATEQKSVETMEMTQGEVKKN